MATPSFVQRDIRAVAVLPSLLACHVMILGCDSGPSPLPPEPAGVLAVTSAMPDSGPTGGAVELTILGRSFQAGATAAFDGVSATTVVVNSWTIKATAPPHPEGAVDIVVINPDGTSARLNGGYRYVPLAIAGVTPRAGFAGMGLDIQGTGFLPGAIVTLGGNQAGATVVNSRIYVTAPKHAPGAVDVVVMNPSGETAMLSGGFFYASVSLTVTPSSVTPGDQLLVSWGTEAGSFDDWIGLFRVGDPNVSGIDFKGTSGASLATQTWLAPSQPGQYEFRYFAGTGGGDGVEAARSNPVAVVGTATVSKGTTTTSQRAGRGGPMRTRER